MGVALTLATTEFNNGKLILEYEEFAEIPGYVAAHILRVVYVRYIPNSSEVRLLGEQIFPASDLPAAIAEYRGRAKSKLPTRKHKAYWHRSMFLTAIVQPDGPGAIVYKFPAIANAC